MDNKLWFITSRLDDFAAIISARHETEARQLLEKYDDHDWSLGEIDVTEIRPDEIHAHGIILIGELKGAK